MSFGGTIGCRAVLPIVSSPRFIRITITLSVLISVPGPGVSILLISVCRGAVTQRSELFETLVFAGVPFIVLACLLSLFR